MSQLVFWDGTVRVRLKKGNITQSIVLCCCVKALHFLQAFYPARHVCPYAVFVWLSISLKWYNRSLRFFLISFCVILLNVLSWPRHTLSTVTRSLEPSVTCLPGLPYTICPQAVAAIWSTNKSHLKVCPNFLYTKGVSARTQLNFGWEDKRY